MDEKELEETAYSMQKAYNKNNNRENACIEVNHEHPNVSWEIIRAMWQAIDAFYDMNIES